MDKKIWLSGIMGVVVGDALGLPVQFMNREEVKSLNVQGMIGYKTFNLPEGSWSDDSSLTLATLSSIKELGEIDCEDIMDRFLEWLEEGRYTPYGYAYDIGRTCMDAICTYRQGEHYLESGGKDEYSNGNGSLMRIMPACLYVYEKVKSDTLSEDMGVELIHEISSLTHAHMRSKIACGFYYFMTKAILDECGSITERLQKGIDHALCFYRARTENLVQLSYFGKLFNLQELLDLKEDDIKSSGYVIDSIEAAVWCLITSKSYEETVLKAINLGGDTDTIGAIAGGLSGLMYGYEGIPKEWKDCIIKRRWIEELCAIGEKKEIFYEGPIVDNHSHFLPGIDDGAENIKMSIDMLKMAEEQGVTELFVTPHGDYVCEDIENYHESFEKLVEEAEKHNIKIEIYKGCEVFNEMTTWDFDDEEDDCKITLLALDKGLYPTYNNTKYVLAEFDIGIQPADALYMMKRIQSGGYIPIIAHAERYPLLVQNYFVEVLVREGCMVQINAYSLEEEETKIFADNARYLLGRGIVHFLGSDAHRSNRRKPRMASGVQYVWETCDQEYARDVIYRNSYKFLLGKADV